MSEYAMFAYFLLFLAISHVFIAYGQNPNYLLHLCPNTTTYTRDSTYFTNLKSLLSYLTSDAPPYSIGFLNSAAGQSPDMVTGFFLCRGDISGQVCRRCVAFAANATLDLCPNEKEVFIWYDECSLRYSYRNILLDPAVLGGTFLMNTRNVTSNLSDRFNHVLLSTMNRTADEALKDSRKFAVGSSNLTAFQTLYVLVQCNPYITTRDCSSCLQQSISGLPRDKVGGRVILLGCNTRYEVYPFYNVSAAETPQPRPLSPPMQPSEKGRRTSSSGRIVAIVVPISGSVLLFVAAVYCFIAKRARKTKDITRDDITTGGSLQFDFRTIEAATNKFSNSNRLGQGGFGEVFKGVLPCGTQVAVKRLSTTSGQGEEEFRNEVVLVAKLQHKNLVKLLGFCVEEEEHILIFEFVPNKSLDYFLFDTTKKGELNWSTRYKIIGGITRGVLYLHQDSRLTIIHRDLKASNVLIDADMNPKIADFGMARIFGMDQTEANTRRVVGTYGYMSPEYAMYGQFSMKSDVYSFGVLVLEIISGRKNNSFYQMDDTVCNLVTYAWRLWSGGSPLELMDPSLGESYRSEEVTRCIHIGLLCVQEDPANRPTLSSILQMITTSSVALPVPQPPGFFFGNRQEPIQLLADGFGTVRFVDKSVLCSVDDASITDVDPR